MNREQIEQYYAELESEISSLKAQLAEEERKTRCPESRTLDYSEAAMRESKEGVAPRQASGVSCPVAGRVVDDKRRKALPVDPITGQDPELRIDNWLPNLECAVLWNG